MICITPVAIGVMQISTGVTLLSIGVMHEPTRVTLLASGVMRVEVLVMRIEVVALPIGIVVMPITIGVMLLVMVMTPVRSGTSHLVMRKAWRSAGMCTAGSGALRWVSAVLGVAGRLLPEGM